MEHLLRAEQAENHETSGNSPVDAQVLVVPRQREPIERTVQNRVCAVPITIVDIVIDTGDGAKTLQAKHAREVHKNFCKACPNTARCLQTALDLGEEKGIWGGLTADERRVLKRRVLGSMATYS